jgi:hypothetical protein
MAHDSDWERQISRDRETIRNWADRHDVVPVREESSAGEDRYRMAPEESMEATHERVEWNRFFEDFEDGDRVVVYHGEDADERFEVAGHDEIVTDLGDEEIEERLLAGESVTSTVTETAVVESVVTEEITIENELVDRETVDQQFVDVDLVSRSMTGCRIADDRLEDDDETFDTDRYLAAVGGTTASAPGGGATTFEGRELSYDAELDVEERWHVTREVTERYVVESEIIGSEITEADSLEDYDLDVQGLHRTIAASGIIEDDLSTEEFLSQHDVESELKEADRVTTSFTRQRTVEDEVVDRMEVHGDLTGGELQDMELVRSEEAIAGGRESDVEEVETAETSGTTQTTDTTGSSQTPDATGTTGTEPETASMGGAALADDDLGKTVVDPTGDEIGTVTGVDEGANAMYVDPNPGLTERIKTALGWGGKKDEDRRLDGKHVDHVTDDEIRLDHSETFGDEDRR